MLVLSTPSTQTVTALVCIKLPVIWTFILTEDWTKQAAQASVMVINLLSMMDSLIILWKSGLQQRSVIVNVVCHRYRSLPQDYTTTLSDFCHGLNSCLYYIHFEITGGPCNLIGSNWCDLFTNRTIFCFKSHLFPSQ